MSRVVVIPVRVSRVGVTPVRVSRVGIAPQHAPRGFVTSVINPGMAGATYRILAETGDVIDAETADKLRTE